MARTTSNNKRIRKTISNKKNRKVLRNTMMAFACIVVFVTTYTLILPALTLEQGALICGKEVHEHNSACYDDVLVCTMQESEEHTHDETCYESQLTCGLEQHMHSKSCYEQPEAAKQAETSEVTEVSAVNEVNEVNEVSEASEASEITEVSAVSEVNEVSETERPDNSADMQENVNADRGEDVVDNTDNDITENIAPDNESKEDSKNETDQESDGGSEKDRDKKSDGENEKDTGKKSNGETGKNTDKESDGEKATEEINKKTDTNETAETEISPVDFACVLTEDTGLWILNSEGTWERVEKKTVIAPSDNLMVCLAFHLPTDTLDNKNTLTCRLPESLKLTPEKATAINENNTLNQIITGNRMPEISAEAYTGNEFLAGKYEVKTTDHSKRNTYDLICTFNEYTATENTNHPTDGWLMFYIIGSDLNVNKKGHGSLIFAETATGNKKLEIAYNVKEKSEDIAEKISELVEETNTQNDEQNEPQDQEEDQAVNEQTNDDQHDMYILEETSDSQEDSEDLNKGSERQEDSETMNESEREIFFMEEPVEDETEYTTETEESTEVNESGENESAETEEALETEEIFEPDETAEAEENTEVEENTEAEETAEAEESSETEETAEAEETTITEETIAAEETTDAEETAETEETADAEETVATEETMDDEETAEAEETTDTEETAATEETMDADETAETEETISSEELYPAQSFTVDTETLTVTVYAKTGAFPAGTTMKVKDVEDENTLSQIKGTVEENSEKATVTEHILAADIKFYDIDGNEIEPLIPIQVAMSPLNATENLPTDTEPVVVHIDKEGKAGILEQRDTDEVIEEIYEEIREENREEIPEEIAEEENNQSENSEESSAIEPTVPEITESSKTTDEIGGEIFGVNQSNNQILSGAKASSAKTDRIKEEDHVDDDKNEDVNEDKTSAKNEVSEGVSIEEILPLIEDAVVFDAEQFSVYAIVYTVDFHWEVDGEMFEFNLTGGDSISFRELVEALHILDSSTAETVADGEEQSNVKGKSIDDFINDINNIEFSDESLVKVVPITEDINAGKLKADLGIEVEYSAELDEEQIEEINEKAFIAPDWVLISLKAFESTEYLKITLETDEVFKIRVTDAMSTSNPPQQGNIFQGRNTRDLDGITIHLFDYGPTTNSTDKTKNLDAIGNNLVNNASSNVGINKNHDLKFYSHGKTPHDTDQSTINTYDQRGRKGYTNAALGINHFSGGTPAVQGIVQNDLEEGYPKLSTGSKENLGYLFNTNDISDAKTVYEDVTGLFQMDSTGKLYYDSNENYAYYPSSEDRASFQLCDTFPEEGSDWGVGFFPFDSWDGGYRCIHGDGIDWCQNKGTNKVGHYNHHFGMAVEAKFQMTADKKMNGQDIVFSFRGDDDMWVFVDGKLVLDIGGVHNPVGGSINFTTGEVKVDAALKVGEKVPVIVGPASWDSSSNAINLDTSRVSGRTYNLTDVMNWDPTDLEKEHEIKIFYLERGGCYSNLKMEFRIPTITRTGDVSFTKKDKETEALLPDASFGLFTDEDCTLPLLGNDNQQIAGTSSDDGIVSITDIPMSNSEISHVYYMKEISAPEGYAISDQKYKVTVAYRDNNQNLSSKIESLPSGEIIEDIENDKNQLTFKKVDENNNALLGSVFTLTRPDGTQVDFTPSGEDASYVFRGLTNGEYSVSEKTAPVPYKVMEGSIEFKVENGVISEITSPALAEWDGDSFTYTVKNEIDVNDNEIKVIKRWIDKDGNPATGTKDVTVQLRRKKSTEHNVNIHFHSDEYNNYGWSANAVDKRSDGNSFSGNQVVITFNNLTSFMGIVDPEIEIVDDKNHNLAYAQKNINYNNKRQITINNVASDINIKISYNHYNSELSQQGNNILNSLTVTGNGQGTGYTEDTDFPSSVDRQKATKILIAGSDYMGVWSIGNGEEYDFPLSDSNGDYVYYVVELKDGTTGENEGDVIPLNDGKNESRLMQISNDEGITGGLITLVNSTSDNPNGGGTHPLPDSLDPEKLPAASSSKVLTPNLNEDGTVDGTYTLTLSVTIPEIESGSRNKANIVIVYDSSNSMDEYTEFEISQDGEYGTWDGEIFDKLIPVDKDEQGRQIPRYYKLFNPLTGVDERYDRDHYSPKNGAKTRMQVAKPIIEEIGEKLLKYNEIYGEGSIELGFVEFGTNIRHGSDDVNRITQIYDDETHSDRTFKNWVDRCSASGDWQGATNWELALKTANEFKFNNDGDQKYIIFISDGNPTVRISQPSNEDGDRIITGYTGNEYIGWNPVYPEGIYGTGNSDILSYNFDAAQAVTKSIINDGTIVFNIGIFGAATRMALLANHGAFEAKNGEDIRPIFDQLIKTITSRIGYTDVILKDGLTSMTSSTLISGTPSNFKYEVKDKHGNPVQDGLIKLGNPEASFMETKEVAEDGTEYTKKEVIWDLGHKDLLLEGGTYSVSFIVWPSQEAYDLVADLNNGKRNFNDLNDIEASQVVYEDGVYKVKTNTHESAQGKTAREVTDTDGNKTITDIPDDYKDIPMEKHVDPMPLTDTTVKVRKKWNAQLMSSQLADVKDFEVNLVLNKENNPYISDIIIKAPEPVTVPESGEWIWPETVTVKDPNTNTDMVQEAVHHISAGLMVSTEAAEKSGLNVDGYPITTFKNQEGEEITYHLLESGRDYFFSETGNSDYRFELEDTKFHPMLVDGILHDVTLSDDKESVISMTLAAGNAMDLTAVNLLKGGIQIKKEVYAKDGETRIDDDRTKFTIKVTMQNPASGSGSVGMPYAISADEGGYRILYGAIRPAGEKDFGNTDAANNQTQNRSQRYGISDGEFTVQIYADETIQIANVDRGVTYEVEEQDIPSGYEKIAIDYEPDVREVASNTSHQVTVKNKRTSKSFIFHKVWVPLNTNVNNAIRIENLKDWENDNMIHVTLRRKAEGNSNPDSTFAYTYQLDSNHDTFQPTNAGLSEEVKQQYQLTKTTSADGKITTFSIDKLEIADKDGKEYTYYVVENSASGSYLYNTYYGAISDLDENATVSATPGRTQAENDQVILNQENQGFELPSTGGTGRHRFWLIGITLMAFAGAGMLLLQRKKKYY